MLAAPLNALVLRALEEGPRQQVELRRSAGSPAQTTLRVQLQRLAELGAIEKHRRNRFPGVLEYTLSQSGRELLAVTDVLERWLARAPDGPRPLGGNAAKAAVKALAEGWSTTMLRALAAGPLSLTELDGVIGSVSYPSLERRLGALRLAGQLKACPSNGRGTPYAVTGWARGAVAPLIAAIRWEQRHQPRDAPPLTRVDLEAAFLLAVPLLRCPEGLTGSCHMIVKISGSTRQRDAGIAVDLVDGGVASYSTRPRTQANASLTGSAAAWFAALIDGCDDGLDLSGRMPLAAQVLHCLQEALFGDLLDPEGSFR